MALVIDLKGLTKVPSMQSMASVGLLWEIQIAVLL